MEASSYNYKKYFFRRPFITPDLLRFWKFLGAVAAVLLAVLFYSLRWVEFLPEETIVNEIKRDYITFLHQERITRGEKFLKPEAEDTARPTAAVVPRLEKTDKSRIAQSVAKAPRGQLKKSQSVRDEARNAFYQLIDPAGGPKVYSITSALESVGGYTALEGATSRQEKILGLRDEEKFLERFDHPIQIPKPEATRFASQNGNRDPEETYAVISSNEFDIEHCIEKIKRYNPRFSGDVLVSFTIHPDDYVIPSSIKILESNITDIRIVQCIKNRIKRWRNFPAIALDDGNFTITRKYVF